ncbi:MULTISPECIES: hypothetical protein [Mediterraneibacter]|uniref:hypothetical protein n=1 Tax=Mediterraneibacter TaxID=2316020 RepID=UPI000E40F282|nr:hypothetical protein [Mediterraneibacter faecis]MCB5919197.1 hypothetical protein [Lachnospiraceae bacterium 210521-DFI.1.105]RGF09770.1 hypothetical protein DW187_13600 [Ruminococcus sp. AM16-34]MCB6297163.1 hypothetical protein [Mediterraneibacter faecis]MCB6445751.1 hypothetical protein [Mediterraneibacter faecis]MCQ5256085.1 hypothetical protein [Mediterraneibacter faecis]
MNKLNIELTNCFGIDSLKHEFDFGKGNTFSIYARNGLMKTSFAKTFQLIQQGKKENISDAIFGEPGSAIVQIDGQDIEKKQVFVVKSYESSYESDISSLLIKGDIQTQLKDVFKVRTKLLKALEKDSGLKIKRTSLGKTVYELEPTIVKDFDFNEKDILSNLMELASYEPEIECSDIPYSVIFDDTVLKKIKDTKFQEGIRDFITSSDEIYSSFEYLEKGNLTLPKLKDLKKSLVKDAFFVKQNKVILSGQDAITNSEALEQHISNIETKIQQTPAYKAIENLLNDSKGIVLKDIIETNPEIIGFLALDKLQTLKKCLWGSYIRHNSILFEELCDKYNDFSEAIDALEIDDTPWKKALDIFNQRFTVPFMMNVVNLKGAIIGESVPQVEFSFKKGDTVKTIDRSKLEKLDTLSQGEKRALYLLNIIFDIEQIKNTGEETLLVIDDIADSFDYKNKYAIIEYLYELAQVSNIYMLILTHNFDFYRTVASRLSVNRSNRLIADYSNDVLKLEVEYYQDKPFKNWKNNPKEKDIFALLPFVRNLIEYGVDQNISHTGEDFLFLTSLLHEKQDSRRITFGDIEPLYKHYAGVTQFDASVGTDVVVLSKLYSVCDDITTSDTKLENKIVLSIGIRHKAEEYIIQQIHNYTGQLSWRKNKQNYRGTNVEFMNFVQNNRNQTRELFNGYKQFGDADKIKILNEVNIMTPEHIHVNSFMYEPILDMDIVELHRLYHTIKNLI